MAVSLLYVEAVIRASALFLNDQHVHDVKLFY